VVLRLRFGMSANMKPYEIEKPRGELVKESDPDKKKYKRGAHIGRPDNSS